MSEQYRLAFSGEVVEGQHPAVVKKRLAAVLKLDDERMDVLFSGKQVIVKRATDEQTAARYQEVFNKAGARLRVLPLEEGVTQEENEPADEPAAAQNAEESLSSDDEFKLMPVGSDVLRDEEREQAAESDIDTSHLSVQGATFAVSEPESEVSAPNVDHITVAEPGADLGVGQDAEEVVVEVDADFDLAEVGALLKEVDAEPAPAVDVDQVDFEVAEPGADIGTERAAPTPAPPDTSHISLEEEPKE